MINPALLMARSLILHNQQLTWQPEEVDSASPTRSHTKPKPILLRVGCECEERRGYGCRLVSTGFIARLQLLVTGQPRSPKACVWSRASRQCRPRDTCLRLCLRTNVPNHSIANRTKNVLVLSVLLQSEEDIRLTCRQVVGFYWNKQKFSSCSLLKYVVAIGHLYQVILAGFLCDLALLLVFQLSSWCLTVFEVGLILDFIIGFEDFQQVEINKTWN